MDHAEATGRASERHLTSRLRDGKWTQEHDELAEEVPVALEYNGIAHAVMLATPADLEAFALGFSLSEGLLPSARDCYGIEVAHGPAGITLQIRISSAAFMLLKHRRRSMTGRSGCGLCGVESLDQVQRVLPTLAPGQPLSSSAIRRALENLKNLQPINRITGGMHAAMWCAPDGEILAGHEDVGRHNALDKLIGAIAQEQMNFKNGFVLMTSRASLELVQKAATVGMHSMVAISAPTALAARTAERCGMTLVAFARGADFVTYANSQNIRID